GTQSLPGSVALRSLESLLGFGQMARILNGYSHQNRCRSDSIPCPVNRALDPL
ncbi:hypothetical protein AVDCRST_MAG92-2757, partial [uncultured Coleofasciculus sp.]